MPSDSRVRNLIHCFEEYTHWPSNYRSDSTDHTGLERWEKISEKNMTGFLEKQKFNQFNSASKSPNAVESHLASHRVRHRSKPSARSSDKLATTQSSFQFLQFTSSHLRKTNSSKIKKIHQFQNPNSKQCPNFHNLNGIPARYLTSHLQADPIIRPHQATNRNQFQNHNNPRTLGSVASNSKQIKMKNKSKMQSTIQK